MNKTLLAVTVLAALLGVRPAAAQTPVDCAGSYTSFSACSASCGGGIQQRTFVITTLPSNGGLACPASVDLRACNVQPCPVDCILSAFSPFSACSVSCGGGVQTRSRSIIQAPAGGG